MKIFTKREILIAVIFFILGVSVTYFSIKPQQAQIPSVKTVGTETSKPLGSITSVKTPKGLVHILVNQDHVSFNPFETAVNNGTYITLKKEKYPKLFQQGIANYSVFRAQEYIDPETKETLVKLSNSQPDHGGWASKYVLLVNPFTGEIKEGENDYSKEK